MRGRSFSSYDETDIWEVVEQSEKEHPCTLNFYTKLEGSKGGHSVVMNIMNEYMRNCDVRSREETKKEKIK